MDSLVQSLDALILQRKVRYPILEFVARALYQCIPAHSHVELCDRIVSLRANGSEVIAGMILQLRLPDHYHASILKAKEYVIRGEGWLPCDTIGERVFGHALLTQPATTIPVLCKLSKSDDKWVVRSVGVAVHYAVKKGLTKDHVAEMFNLLLSLATTTDFHTKKGIGWAAKTIAKFHPDIIAQFESEIKDDPAIRTWFRTKVKIGLSRTYKYAGRYTS